MENTINKTRDEIYALIEEFRRLVKLNEEIVRSIYKNKNLFLKEEALLTRSKDINGSKGYNYTIKRLSERITDYFGKLVIIKNDCNDKTYLLKLRYVYYELLL